MDLPSRLNHSADSATAPGRSYALEVAVQPPRVARSGARLFPPLAIRLHISDASTGEEISGEDELNSLFAQAILYGESGDSPPLAPPDMYLLSGQLSMSLDLLNDDDDDDDDGPKEDDGGEDYDDGSGPLSSQRGSYAIFPDLTINRAGRYRLGVSLFKIGGRRPSSRAMPSDSGDAQGGGTSLGEVKSNVIVVQQSPAQIQIDDGARRFLEHIRNRGTNVPSPPPPPA